MSDDGFIRIATPEEAATWWGEAAPDGFVVAVFEDQRWRTVDDPNGVRRCRRNGRNVRCDNRVVAALLRAHRGTRGAWWNYCAEHMYGRWIEDGKVVSLRLSRRPGGADEGSE